VDSLCRHKEAIFFKEPVRPTKNFVPDYFNHIDHPMDLKTVRDKLGTTQYTGPDEFVTVRPC
jgi:Bromodomain